MEAARPFKLEEISFLAGEKIDYLWQLTLGGKIFKTVQFSWISKECYISSGKF
jgi:hypothetical protein